MEHRMLQELSAWLCFLTLTATALIHAYWGFGGLWPATTEPELVRTVIGINTSESMPSLPMTLIVAALIFIAGGFAFVSGILKWNSAIFLRFPLIVLTAIFIFRGAYTYWPNSPLATATEPFATLNAHYFSPLILMLGLGFGILSWMSRPG
jgi:hypothetical protein